MKDNLHAALSFPGIITLMYHRIDVPDTNPWNICVSPEHFEEQIKFLKAHFKVISSPELIKDIRLGKDQNNCICITFDDGYKDNYINAKPILEKHNCPATFFIPTAYIGSEKNFWWDELEIILLHSKHLPGELQLQSGNSSFTYRIEETELSEQQWQQHKNWKWYQQPPTSRCAAFISIWENLRISIHEEIAQVMSAIKSWAVFDSTTAKQRLPMKSEQLITLSENNLFTIGLHTNTHPDLNGKQKQYQMEEISNGKEALKNKFGISSNCLAYPYGRYDAVTIEAVKQMQLDACFTTEASNINAGADVTKLGRYQAADWNIEEFKNNLQTFLKSCTKI